ALAAMEAVLDRIEAEGPRLQRNLNLRATGLVAELNDVCTELDAPLRFSSFGSVYYPKFIGAQPNASLFYFYMRLHDVHVWEGRPWFISTEHSDDDLQTVVGAVRRSVVAMQQAGLFAGEANQLPTVGVPGQTIGGVTRLPLTDAQREMWLASQLNLDASCVYNIACGIDFESPVDVNAMKEAFRSLIARHESLRASFDPGGEFQTIRNQRDFDLTVVDLRDQEAQAQHREVEQRRALEMETPFELEHAPLVRATLFLHGPARSTLLVTFHHIVCDGWSASVALADLERLYAIHHGTSDESLLPADSYAEFASAEAVDLKHRIECREYWDAEYADGQVPVVELPKRGSLARGTVGRAERLEVNLDPSLCEALKNLAVGQRVTLNSVLLAGYAVLLSRLADQRDMALGMPVAGQPHHGQPDLIGHCMNYMPMRLHVDPDATVSSLLRDVNAKMLAAVSHYDYTYGNLIESLARRSRHRLPSTIGVDFNADVEEPDRTSMFGCKTRFTSTHPRFTQLDMKMNIVRTGDAILAQCTVNVDVLDRTAVQIWLEAWQEILAGFARNAEQAVASVDAAGGPSSKVRYEAYNATHHPLAEPQTVHERFADRVRQSPRSTALVCGAKKLTYAELDLRTDQLARLLRERGVQPDTIVGICTRRGVDTVVAMLGVMKSGAAYLPLDPEFPDDRLAYMVEDSKCRCVIVDQSTEARRSDWPAPSILIDELPSSFDATSTGSDGREAGAHDLAYVMYTSGSTGRPKGVAIEHRALTNFLESMRRRPGFESTDRLLAVTTISFDISVLEIFLPLVVGGTVFIAPDGAASDPEKLASLLDEADITVMQATPATWRLLLAADWPGKKNLRVLCGGEPMSRDLA
ncbi:MAG: condensation domain-containing protein, partial [Pirellulales bacterium]|nr:condensation domain-containing protein [Pirellulales bacterium]